MNFGATRSRFVSMNFNLKLCDDMGLDPAYVSKLWYAFITPQLIQMSMFVNLINVMNFVNKEF